MKNEKDLKIESLDLEKISEPRIEYRQIMNREELDSLKKSIQEHGQVVPVIVRPKDGKYELVAGTRRLYALRELGEKTIKAQIMDLNEKETLCLRALENDERVGINQFERALYYRRVINELKISLVELAKIVNRSEATVIHYLDLLDCDPIIQEAVRAGHIGIHKALLLQKFRTPNERKYYLELVINNGVTLQVLNEWLRAQLVGGAKSGEVRKKEMFQEQEKEEARYVEDTLECQTCTRDTPLSRLNYLRVCPDCYKIIMGGGYAVQTHTTQTKGTNGTTHGGSERHGKTKEETPKD